MGVHRRCQLGNSPQVRLLLPLATLLLIFPSAVQAQLMIIGTHPETPTIIANRADNSINELDSNFSFRLL